MNDKKESLKDLVLRLEKENQIVIMTFEGPMSMDLDEAIDNQPIDGLLYDLNRDAATVITHIDNNPKWINDYAVQLVIKRLKERLDKLEKKRS